jgi:ArsR family transcriptional regulator, arsenate/arsenite/antimonite-responsive transcriptional repressor
MSPRSAALTLAEPASSSGEADGLALLAKALGHPARIHIIETLLKRQTCIGCDLVDEIGLAASTTSEHLRILKEARIITGEIARPRVCYALAPGAVTPLIDFLTRIRGAPVSTQA